MVVASLHYILDALNFKFLDSSLPSSKAAAASAATSHFLIDDENQDVVDTEVDQLFQRFARQMTPPALFARFKSTLRQHAVTEAVEDLHLPVQSFVNGIQREVVEAGEASVVGKHVMRLQDAVNMLKEGSLMGGNAAKMEMRKAVEKMEEALRQQLQQQLKKIQDIVEKGIQTEDDEDEDQDQDQVVLS